MVIRGTIETSPDPRRIGGWARDVDGGTQPLTIEARLDNMVIAQGKNTLHRPDLGGRFGFLLNFPDPIAIDAVKSGRLVISARAADGPATPLLWLRTLVDLLDARDVGRKLAPLPIDRMVEAITFAAEQVAADPSRTPADARAFARLGTLVQMVKQPGHAETHFVEPLGYVATAPGTVSADGTALIGRSGHIYLCAGTNRLTEQFEMRADDPRVRLRADGWAATFRGRADALRQRGIRYVQTIIPEKVSVIPDHWPGPITTPSPTLGAIEERLSGGQDDFYFSAQDALHGDGERLRTFRKIDTHLSWYGTRLLFGRFCRAAGIEPPFMGDVELGYSVAGGDFTDRFPGLPLLERIETPQSAELAAAAVGLDPREMPAPDPRNHIGTHAKWHNPTAPIDRKLLVFGNSFVEVGRWPLTLSWWFARAFRDYEFVWNPDVDLSIVDASKPDIVIGQTIERFLTRVPER